MSVARLDAEIRKVCPIDGVDSSGRISFQKTATAQQKEAAQAVVASFDWNLVETKPPTIEERLAALEAKVFADATKTR